MNVPDPRVTSATKCSKSYSQASSVILTRDFRRRHKLHARVTRRRLLGGSAGEDIVKTRSCSGRKTDAFPVPYGNISMESLAGTIPPSEVLCRNPKTPHRAALS